MAFRIQENEVLEIMDTALTQAQITPFLQAANLVVTDKLTGEYRTDLLAEIERWLAAHLAAMLDPQTSREKLGDADATYEGKTGMGLDFTRYGQQVKVLEYKGILAELGQSKGPAEAKTIT
ncbi:MAG TPA: DUF4054 domain-containing protein [candidate division Zixibacteria bacterium]|nr:DUF4054 domain-containing protein [candidate division Zixibacteria bacterium]HEQ98812.1 DUF4054 domain-containing protein [candidate division Zixibacteria bacterium]